ncbi:uncharacterized protein OCT59_011559 [Rhizophagus irregularis]|uniref:uncharacterized protein n=1 Tax=Rhizophagus irregularis TaxID=588596 RepID=UPI00332B308E|nr:hypothetical protein OCT59_011559 [Rhizophagus irregularis]
MNNDTPQHTPSVKDVDKNIINDPGPSTSTLTTSSSTSSISTSPTTPQILFPQAGWSHATHGIRFQLLECLVLLL